MMARAQELGSQRFVVTAAQVVAVIMSVVLTGGGSVWWLSGEWATVHHRLDQNEEAVKAAEEAVKGAEEAVKGAIEAAETVRERLTAIESDSRNDRRILLRLENKIDAWSPPTRFGRSESMPPQ